ncbi:hypothetical protein Tco_0932204 [Tanacetum coccineum]
MSTEMELTLEQTQQGVSYEVSNIRVISFTMKMEILLEPTSNKLMVERFDTSARNLVKEILLKLNLPDHRSILTDSKVTPTKHGRMTKPYSSPCFIANCSIWGICKDSDGDSRAKGVIVDDAAAPSAGVSRPRPSSGPSPSFRDVSGDAIHTELFLFSTGPYYAIYPKDVSALKKQVSRLNDKLSSSHASFAKSKEKGKERKKKIKSLTKSLDNFDTKVARLFDALNQATILEGERDEEILRLKTTPPEFLSFFRGQFQGLVWKFLAFDEFSRVQGKLLSLAASEEAIVNPFRV